MNDLGSLLQPEDSKRVANALIDKICLTCGKEWKVPPSRASVKYCSRPCVKLPTKTPEQEEYRLSRVRAAVKGKPQSEAHRKAISTALRKGWAEGRIKPSGTPESIEKTASKLRGRKRPAEVVERVRLKNTGKKRSPEVVAAMRQRMLEGYANGTHRLLTPEDKKARGLKISQTIVAKIESGWRPDPEIGHKHSQRMRGYVWSREVIEARAEPMRGRPQKAEATKTGPTNVNSREGAFRDAAGRIWRFRNISHFVRTHPELFDPEDLIMRRSRPTKPALTCNAIKRMCSLSGRGGNTLATWKGWTLVSETEQGEDLLSRNLPPVEQA